MTNFESFEGERKRANMKPKVMGTCVNGCERRRIAKIMCGQSVGEGGSA
jgi:hypothetical protein